MKLYFSPASPFVRKCMVVAHELNLRDRIELLPSQAHPVSVDAQIAQSNPLGQVPTFFTDDGQALYDSRVICEYLDSLGEGSIFPKASRQRWQALTDQSLADGILDAALLARYESVVRPEHYRWPDWTDSQMNKITRSLALFETTIGERGGNVDIGTITLACALGYLDFRFPEFDWRAINPGLAAWFNAFGNRQSMAATMPHV